MRSLVRDRVVVEQGSLKLPLGTHVAVIAHWSAEPRTTQSVCTLVRELQTFGYRVIVSSSCEARSALVWDESVNRDELLVLRKPNVGYDFGSWATALGLLPELAGADRLLLVNDSMAGPFRPLRLLLEAFDHTRADVWGLTDTQQFGRHLQSYFIGFCDGALTNAPLRHFWASVRHEEEKFEIIMRYEIGLSRLLVEEGYVQLPAFPQERYVEPGQNPVIIGWRRLLENGFPFLKREILRDPSVAPAGEEAPAFVKQLLGVDVRAWVDDLAA